MRCLLAVGLIASLAAAQDFTIGPPIADGVRPPPITKPQPTPPKTTEKPQATLPPLASCPDGTDKLRLQLCTEGEAATVCSSENKAYRNLDCAICNGVKDYEKGECKDEIATCVAGANANYANLCKTNPVRAVCSRLTNRQYKNNYCA